MKNIDGIICIVGPTATGKSDVANLLASKIDGEVISADSMQIYKGMNIGTGKIREGEKLVAHWGLDIVNPNEAYSVALFQKYARRCIEDIKSRGKTPVLCGGTGFYIRSVIDDYDFPAREQTQNPVREKYIQIAEDKGPHELWEVLNSKDPKSAQLIHENNVVRVVRALELLEEGKSYHEQKENLSEIKEFYPSKIFGLKVDPDTIRQRIDERVDKMIDAGLVDEVKSLLDENYREALTAASAIGYKEIVSYLDGECPLDEAVEQIKTATKQYAKRQRTWFNKDSRINWIDYEKIAPEEAVQEIILCCDKGQ